MVYPRVCSLPTMVVYPRVCSLPTMVGIPGWYILLYMPPILPWVVYTLYMPPTLYTPGYTVVHTLHRPYSGSAVSTVRGAGRGSPGLKRGNHAGYGAPVSLRVLKV